MRDDKKPRTEHQVFAVNSQELRSILVGLQTQNNLDSRTITRSIREKVNPDQHSEWAYKFGTPAELTKFTETVQLRAADLELIAEVFETSRLTLDQLVAARTEKKILTHGPSDFFSVEPPQGCANIRYSIPLLKIAETEDLSIAYLELGENSRSYWHHHNGDEINVCASGSVEIQFLATGLSATLNEGDFVHFYAEQDHRVVSKGRSRLVTIRSLKLKTPGSRVEFSDSVHEAPGRTTDLLVRRMKEEMGAVILPRSSARLSELSHMVEIQDRVGLGQLLRNSATGLGNRRTLRELEQRSGWSRSKIERLHRGQTPVNKDDLGKISEIYDLAPILLVNYFFPAFRTAVAAHGPAWLSVEWEEVPNSLLKMPGDSNSNTARYFVPVRRLADSDTSIARVKLRKDESTPLNHHPGHEVLIPLKGEFDVIFDNANHRVKHREQLLCQFASHVEHQVVNPYDEPAELITIRFY